MAAKEDVPLKTERTVHHSNSSSGKKSQAAQPHVNDDRSSSRASANLTPVFDREDNLKHLDVAYNEASSSEESDYNQASVIFSLDELQNSLTGLQTSISPEIPPLDNKSSAGLLFPTLIQDEDENFSMSSKEDEESDQNSDEFNLSSTSPPVEDYLKNLAKTDVPHDDVPVDNKVTKCSTRKVNSPNTEVQPDIVITSDDSLLYHINSSVAAVDSMAVETVPSDVSSVPATVHPKSLTYTTHIEDSSVVGVALDDTSPQVETPHVETSSDVTITQSTPIETPTATSNKSLSGIELLGETELSNSPTSANPDNSPTSANPDNIFMHEKSTDSISMSGGMASGDGSKSLSEKLKSTPNTFESPALNTFESPGLLYAHPVKKSSKQVVETLEPAEAATEALLAEEKSSVATSQENRHIRAKADKRGKLFIDQMHLPSFNYKQLTGIPLFYPPDRTSNTAAADELLLNDSVLKDIEKNARKVAENLDYMLDNLRYSLHAMATCTKLSVSLHKEAIDDIHVTVDESIKMMYAFLAKFEELNSNMKPIEALAAQIKDVSESLKVLEKAIR